MVWFSFHFTSFADCLYRMKRCIRHTHTHTHWAHRGKIANDKRKIGWVLFSFCVGKQTKGASVARIYNEENVNRLDSICIHIVNCRECVSECVCCLHIQCLSVYLLIASAPKMLFVCDVRVRITKSINRHIGRSFFLLSLLLLLSVFRLRRNCIILM